MSKKKSSKLQGNLFPFSFSAIRNFRILSVAWQIFRARRCTSSRKPEIENSISLTYGNYPWNKSIYDVQSLIWTHKGLFDTYQLFLVVKKLLEMADEKDIDFIAILNSSIQRSKIL